MAKITTGITNGDIKITPNGTGKTVVGTGAASATVQSSGDYDLVLQTGNATTGSITITDGANGDIAISPNGTGTVVVNTDLDVDNININGNAITSTNTNGNVAITPNGTGEVDISKVDIDGGNIDNTTIGGTTPAAGTFTTFTSTGITDNASSTALTIDSSGNVLANTFKNLAGTGAPDFPNGLTLAGNTTGGSVTGVTLNDYEEGEWAPTDASGAGLTFTVNSAKYTKVGNAVHLQLFMIFPSTASGAQINIGGLPFANSTYDFNTMPLNSNVSGAHVVQIQELSTNFAIKNQLNQPFINSQFSSKFIIFSGTYLTP